MKFVRVRHGAVHEVPETWAEAEKMLDVCLGLNAPQSLVDFFAQAGSDDLP